MIIRLLILFRKVKIYLSGFIFVFLFFENTSICISQTNGVNGININQFRKSFIDSTSISPYKNNFSFLNDYYLRKNSHSNYFNISLSHFNIKNNIQVNKNINVGIFFTSFDSYDFYNARLNKADKLLLNNNSTKIIYNTFSYVLSGIAGNYNKQLYSQNYQYMNYGYPINQRNTCSYFK